MNREKLEINNKKFREYLEREKKKLYLDAKKAAAAGQNQMNGFLKEKRL